LRERKEKDGIVGVMKFKMSEVWKKDKDNEIVHMRWSDFPTKSWLQICIPDPKQFQYMPIRISGLYAVFEAYFPFMKEKRVFKLVLPYNKLKSALMSVPEELRNPDNGYMFEIYKGEKGLVKFRNWEVIEK